MEVGVGTEELSELSLAFIVVVLEGLESGVEEFDHERMVGGGDFLLPGDEL